LLLLLPLPVMQYVGEEGLYAMKSWEMHLRHDILHTYLMGSMLSQSPLYHWPVIAMCNIIGWEHVDIAGRMVSVAASWTSALVAGLMARRLFPQYSTACWLAALVYLSMGEVMFWYGWLGYADATFGCFIFAAISVLWLAIEREHPGWLVLSLILISLAFLTKNITAYVLYGLAGLVLLQRLHRWHLLRRVSFLAPGLLALLVPWLYQIMVIHSSANTMATFYDGLRNFQGYHALDFVRHWLTYPFIFIFRALPASLFLLWLWLVKRHRFEADASVVTVAWIILACLAPFWASAGGTPRYLVPLYGLVAVLLTGLLLQLDKDRFKMAVKIILVVLILKIPYSFAVLPWLKDWRPDHSLKAVAADVLQRTRGTPVRTQNDIASGLAIAAYMDVQLPPDQYIHWYDGEEHGVFIITEQPETGFGELVKAYPIRGRHLYLYRRH